MSIEATRMLEARIRRLENMLDALCDALLRQGSEQDGNWGYPPFETDLKTIRAELADAIRTRVP